MKQQDIFKKVGIILKELNEQYEYLQTEETHFNDLELELFIANARFLTDHAEILKKVIGQSAAPLALPPAHDPETLGHEMATVQLDSYLETMLPPLSENAVAFNAWDEQADNEPEATYHETPSAVLLNQAEPVDANEQGIEIDQYEEDSTEEPVQIVHEPEVEILPEFATNDNYTEAHEDNEPEEDALMFSYLREPEPEQEREPIADVDLQPEVDLEPSRPMEIYSYIREPETGAREEFSISTHSEPEPEPVPADVAPDEPEILPQVEAQKMPENPVDDVPLTLNQRLSAQVSQANTASSIGYQRVTDLKAAINLNDKMLFVKDLFNGYSLAYSEAIELLNRCKTFIEADKFLKANYVAKNNWAGKQTTADKFYEVLRKRFPL